ncbi:phosphogluconate dehydrogenase C-terminal domain-containing protein [Aestuariimicrobium ganziense]|uniref:phosphogluconate dehydrogenase C-terminal domain-containing protein n=1 Tax=Aestuariimicrobium ganziense TaxID=2773677 RepID=UPI001941A1EA|nr:phosphogluconate dehydrogenase C-terminal domain-containing protein [Aestuariimicrobium ganziense]
MKVTILGAGGNMGRRVSRSLEQLPHHELRLVEPGAIGQEKMAAECRTPIDLEQALDGTDVVVFAVPDRIVRQVAADIVPKLAPRTAILFLDPAAVAAGRIPHREDITCCVVHPTHPPLYGLMDEESPEARRDYWGGGLAHQALVFSLAWGEEALAERVEALCVDMFAPISRSHRITVDQMALLEPALTETLTNGCVAIIKEGLERVIDLGVPREAATDFLMGHFQIGIALIFDQLDWKLSEGAQMALEQSRQALFRDDWHAIFEHERVQASLRQITGGD